MPTPVRIYRLPGTPTITLPKLKTYGLRDEFERANNPTSLGTSLDNKTWVALRGTWGIDSGSAYVSDTSFSGGMKIATAQTYAADGTIEAQFTAVDSAGDGSAGLILRTQDLTNHLIVNGAGGGKIRLWKRVGNVATAIADGPSSAGTIATGDTITVAMEGTRIRVYRNGTLVIDQTVTEFATLTTHGIALGAAGTRIGRIRLTPALT